MRHCRCSTQIQNRKMIKNVQAEAVSYCAFAFLHHILSQNNITKINKNKSITAFIDYNTVLVTVFLPHFRTDYNKVLYVVTALYLKILLNLQMESHIVNSVDLPSWQLHICSLCLSFHFSFKTNVPRSSELLSFVSDKFLNAACR